ncbi:MAG: hypoxanthine-guanine phosphoribosyltransferase [Thiotrichales bacterium]
MTDSTRHEDLLKDYDCLHDAATVERAIDRVAAEINRSLHDQDVLALCVLHGGLIFAGHVLTRLDFSVALDYIHATRYRGATIGDELHWIANPRTALAGRQILLLDDIFDEGLTLHALHKHCLAQGATRVYTAVLAEKDHPRAKADYRPDFVGLTVEDRYVFGMGMDYKHRLRNVHGIYAVRD